MIKIRVIIPFLLLLHVQVFCQVSFYVSVEGNDENPGTIDRPFATLVRAKEVVRNIKPHNNHVTVFLRSGTYYLSEPVVFSPEDSGTKDAPIWYKAYEGEKVTISGGVKLAMKWRPYKNGIVRARINLNKYGITALDQLFINGRLQRMARYPNYDTTAQFFGGTSKDAISPDRVKTWKNPQGGFMHALHQGKWGSKHYRIESASEDGLLTLTGGWQENRGGTDKNVSYREGYHKRHLFVENIFEELDDEEEWYFDKSGNYLYLKPDKKSNLKTASVVASNLKQLFVLVGSVENPVKNIHFDGLDFRHTNRVFMEPYERLLRGDWSIARQSAVFFEGTVSCSVKDCNFEDLGGNAVFFSKYNRQGKVLGSRFYNIGESAVCLVGSVEAVRSPSIEYRNSVPHHELDHTPGPKSSDYPANCLVENNLMHNLGLIGKQVAGVFMSMAEEINVRHNTIYNIPRAAICINDGAWGGHVIENNDVFNTVRESGDHGPFNSWGRDRYWLTPYHGRDKGDESGAKERSLLDNYKITYIRHNRMAHPGGHSWGIDLDDGSSNYHLYNNLCLGMGFKLREGFYRRVENNIVINGFGGFHVWFKDCGDIIAKNIIVSDQPFQFIHADPAYAREFNYNLFYAEGETPMITGLDTPITINQWQERGYDQNSLVADPMFIDPANGDFRVRENSPALALGFQNFRMDNFGVYKPQFVKEVAPVTRSYSSSKSMGGSEPEERSNEKIPWLGATVKNLVGNAEKSVAGIAEITGVIVVELPQSSQADEAGFKQGDVIVALNGTKIHDTTDLMEVTGKISGKEVKVVVTGNPIKKVFSFTLK